MLELECNKNGDGEIFQAWVEDYGTATPLSHYKKKVKADVASCYIKSVHDKRFRICVNVDDTSQSLCCDLSIDGQCVSSYFMGKWTDNRLDTELAFETIDGGPGQAIPLKFGKTQTSGMNR
jgi:hypothetical protein